MKIRAGYEIAYECQQPTPMILTLSVHPSRIRDLLTQDRMQLDPFIPANWYRDGFGNICHVIHAPKGRLTLFTDFLIRDDGQPLPGGGWHGDLPDGWTRSLTHEVASALAVSVPTAALPARKPVRWTTPSNC